MNTFTFFRKELAHFIAHIVTNIRFNSLLSSRLYMFVYKLQNVILRFYRKGYILKLDDLVLA